MSNLEEHIAEQDRITAEYEVAAPQSPVDHMTAATFETAIDNMEAEAVAKAEVALAEHADDEPISREDV